MFMLSIGIYIVKLPKVQLSILGHCFSLWDFPFRDGQKEERNKDEIEKEERAV